MSEEYREDTVSISVSFPVPVNLTREHQVRLVELIDEICDGYEARHPDRTMWAAGIGGAVVSMPITKEDEENGVPLEFDMSVFSIDCCERENYEYHPAETVQ